jgi:hypothetical protein
MEDNGSTTCEPIVVKNQRVWKPNVEVLAVFLVPKKFENRCDVKPAPKISKCAPQQFFLRNINPRSKRLVLALYKSVGDRVG